MRVTIRSSNSFTSSGRSGPTSRCRWSVSRLWAAEVAVACLDTVRAEPTPPGVKLRRGARRGRCRCRIGVSLSVQPLSRRPADSRRAARWIKHLRAKEPERCGRWAWWSGVP